jgi:hypothetical protein
MAASASAFSMREKLGSAYSVPRRTRYPEEHDILRRSVGRAGCPQFFAPWIMPGVWESNGAMPCNWS